METSTRQGGQPLLGSRVKRPNTFASFPPASLRDDTIGHTPPRAMGSWRTTGPGGNAQPAASSVMAGRRIFDRNHHQQSRPGSSTMRSAYNVHTNTPARIFSSSSFRSGFANGNGAKFTFSPRVPTHTMRESFPTVTPGRSFQGSTADINGRAMSKTSGSNLFPMRITSPPPELDGEELAKQVPNNPNRVGSVYADEYLSHLVPPELDDLQRRQFLCILDLRRLKYAASEIFAKKDWRVNIMNFAKEYEKSRSLIMLRYGLYEFKTVPASRELLKKWKQENNVPHEDDDMADAPTTTSNGAQSSFRSSIKRRAEDELTKDNAPEAVSATPGKRRATDREPLTETRPPTSNAGATPFPKKTKRGAEHLGEPDENQPNKLQRSTQSATLSMFAEVASKSPAQRTLSPTKSAPKSLFAQSTQTNSGASVLNGGFKAPSSGNIFGHLSGENSPKGSEHDEESEGESENDVAEAPASKSKAPSTATSKANAAPSIFGVKPSLSSGDSSSAGSSLSKGPSLFDRIAKGVDGEPVRAADSEGDKPSESSGASKRPASPVKQSQPQDKTWNPDTPIKFGAGTAQTGTSLFGASTTQPSSIFSKTIETPKASAAPAFGTQVQDFAKETPKPAVPSLFGQTAKPSEPSNGLFSNATKTPLFGASTLGQQKPEKQDPDSTKPPATPSLFGSQSQAVSSTPFGMPKETPAAQPQGKSLFSGLNPPAATTQSSAPSIFGNTTAKPGSSLFGAVNGDKTSTNAATGAFGIFGANSTAEEKKEDSAPKRRKPDSDEAGAVFGSESVDQPKKYQFGGSAPAPAENLPAKTAAAAKGATDAASVFGASSQRDEKSYSFGSAPATSAPAPAATPAPSSIFGNASTSQNEPAKTQPSIFASSTAPSTGFTFGSGSSSAPSFGVSNNKNSSDQPASLFGNNGAPAPSSFTFNTGGDQGSFKNPFASGGDASAPVSFDFGSSTNGSGAAPFHFGGGTTSAAPASTSFTFGAGSQPATNGPASSSFTFGAASQPANNTPAPSSNIFGGGAASNGGGLSPFNFGGASQPQSQPAPSSIFNQPANAAQGIFASQLAVPPAGSSTGTNTPLFGGASSLATTPATGTPEPEAKKENSDETADEDGKPQEQLSLTDGGPGEEDEEVVHEVRAKALRLIPPRADDGKDGAASDKKNASPWNTEGLGPLRVLKHKTTGAVRILLRAEPRGNVAMNKLVLPDFPYKVDKGAKWVKVTAAKDDGKGLETWMLQVKNNELAVKLAAVLEENKMANKTKN